MKLYEPVTAIIALIAFAAVGTTVAVKEHQRLGKDRFEKAVQERKAQILEDEDIDLTDED